MGIEIKHRKDGGAKITKTFSGIRSSAKRRIWLDLDCADFEELKTRLTNTPTQEE